MLRIPPHTFMARVYPLQPYRYSAAAGPLAGLVTQPYDKITPEMRERYLSLSPYNLVRIVLGERRPEDNAADNVYTRAKALLEEWVAGGILEREPAPCYYAYFQDFTDPDTGGKLTRKGFIGLGGLEPYSAGVIHRHEQTLSGPKQDRMELLRHTRAQLEQLFLLYPDPEGAIDRLLDDASRGEPLAAVEDEYGAVHRMWRIAEPARVEEIGRLMERKKLIIADGHHRYETALAFHEQHPGMAGAGRVPMTFVNMHSPGLRILATHRLVSGLDHYSPEAFLARAAADFQVTPLDSLDGLRRVFAEARPAEIRIGVAAGPGRFALLTAPRAADALDVTVLHERILEGMLGITPEAVRNEQYLRYARGIEKAAMAVASGAAQLAFLLEPTSMEQVARVSFSGGVMPQKSTDFYPKLLSGLTVYPLD